MMGTRLFALRIWQFELQYDRDYGIDKRNGWSVIWDGSTCTQFASDPFSAIIRSLRAIRSIVRYRKELA